MGIAEKIQALNTEIRACERKFHRIPNSVSLLLVTKGQSIQRISEAIAAGQTRFGENYLQEALAKMAFFTGQNIEWHFIGSIQRNKTKKIAEFFSWVHSINSPVIAKRLNDQRPFHLPPLNVCLEVNISAESTKAGANIEDITALAAYVSSMPNLRLRGLMAIPEPKKIFSEQKMEFEKLSILFKKLQENGFQLDTLSMGMSNDWIAAIAEGATLIRIGTAVFGARNPT